MYESWNIKEKYISKEYYRDVFITFTTFEETARNLDHLSILQILFWIKNQPATMCIQHGAIFKGLLT